jgi:hypothetical protein
MYTLAAAAALQPHDEQCSLLKHWNVVPSCLHVVVLNGEDHHEDEEESGGREKVPEVVVVKDEDGARAVQVAGLGRGERRALELPSKEEAAEYEEGE